MQFRKAVLLAAAGAALGFGQTATEETSTEKAGGIQVHGHWVLEVKNPDGSVAAKKEFENSLVNCSTCGAVVLANLFTGTYTAGPWDLTIQFNGGIPNSNNVGFLYSAQTLAACTALGTGCSSSLTVSVNTLGQIVLQGSTPVVPATLAGAITAVNSGMFYCSPTTAADACTASAENATGLTSATVSEMPVLAGQTVTATVTINFSSSIG